MVRAIRSQAIATTRRWRSGASTAPSYGNTFNRTMQRMWVNYACRGDPSLTAEEPPTGKVIRWGLCDSDTKPIRAFDEFNIHQGVEGDCGIVDWERAYLLTKYFIF